MLPYTIVRSRKRKTLSLQVKHGQITVRAPYFVAESFIDQFVVDKTNWLQDKIHEQSQQKDERCSFENGADILFLGTSRQLVIVESNTPSVYLDENENTLIVSIGSRSRSHIFTKSGDDAQLQRQLLALQVKKQLEAFFKDQLTGYLDYHLAHFVDLTHLQPKSFHVRQYKSRWGSCNSKGELQFNYLLVMAPSWVIDYVIVHELCHLKFLNHSKDFWQLVSTFQPDFRLAKAWFKKHQSQLHWRI